MNWSIRPDKRFQLALGSFVEEYNNRVSYVTVYSMNWSIRPDKRFRLALGSFVEEYNNRVGYVVIYTRAV